MVFLFLFCFVLFFLYFCGLMVQNLGSWIKICTVPKIIILWCVLCTLARNFSYSRTLLHSTGYWLRGSLTQYEDFNHAFWRQVRTLIMTIWMVKSINKTINFQAQLAQQSHYNTLLKVHNMHVSLSEFALTIIESWVQNLELYACFICFFCNLYKSRLESSISCFFMVFHFVTLSAPKF